MRSLPFLAVAASVSLSVLGQSAPVLDDVAGLEAFASGTLATNAISRIMPPGVDLVFRYDAGPLGFAETFGTNFLAQLAGVARGPVTTFPVEVSESNAEPRLRFYANALGDIVHTSAPPAGYTATNWIVSTYGQPGPWLTDTNLDAWYAERDPARQRIRLELIATNDVPAYTAWLTNEIASVESGGTTNSLLDLYANDIAFVKTVSTDDVVRLYVHAPTNVPRLDLFASADMLVWTLPATLEHASDPVVFQALEAGAAATSNGWMSFAAGHALLDTDGDGIADAREILVTLTDANNADTDGDGLDDGEEILRTGSNPGAWSTGDSGLGDGWLANTAGMNPNQWHDASAVDADGLTLADRQRLGIGTQHVVVVDLGPNDVLWSNRTVTSTRSLPLEGFPGAMGTGGYYRTLHVNVYHKDDMGGHMPKDYFEWKTDYDWLITGVTNCDTHLRKTGTMSQRTHTEDELGNVKMDTTYSWAWTNGNSHEIHTWLTTTGGTETTNSQYQGVDPRAVGCDLIAVESDSDMTLTMSSYEDGSGWNSASLGCGTNWTMHQTYAQPLSLADMDSKARADVTDTNQWHNLQWGSNRTVQFCAAHDLEISGDAAVRATDTNNLSVGLRRLQYGLHLASSSSGVVYRATVAHIYTPTNAFATAVVVTVTNLLGFSTNGGPLYLLPTNGVAIDPPTNNGTICPLICRLQANFTNDYSYLPVTPVSGGSNNMKWCIATFPAPQQTNILWTVRMGDLTDGSLRLYYRRGASGDVAITVPDPDINLAISNGALCKSISLVDGTNDAPHVTLTNSSVIIDSVMHGDRVILQEATTKCRDQIAVVKNYSWNDLMRNGLGNLRIAPHYDGLCDEVKTSIVSTILFCLDARSNREQAVQFQNDEFPSTSSSSTIFTNFRASHTNLLLLAIPSARSIGIFPDDFEHFHIAMEASFMPSAILAKIQALLSANTNQPWTTLAAYQDRTASKLIDLANAVFSNQSLSFLLSHTYESGAGAQASYVDPLMLQLLKSGDPVRNIRTNISSSPWPELSYKGSEDDAEAWLNNDSLAPPIQVWQVELLINRRGQIELLGSAGGDKHQAAMISDALGE